MSEHFVSFSSFQSLFFNHNFETKPSKFTFNKFSPWGFSIQKTLEVIFQGFVNIHVLLISIKTFRVFILLILCDKIFHLFEFNFSSSSLLSINVKFLLFSFSANLQFRTLPRQGHLGHVHRNPNDSGTLLSVIPSQSFMGGSVMGHHTIRRPTQSGLVETIPTSMAGSFYPRNLPLAINTSQHQQFFYGWQMSPVPTALSPVVTMPQSILKQSVNYQKAMMDAKEEKEKRDTTWVSFDV